MTVLERQDTGRHVHVVVEYDQHELTRIIGDYIVANGLRIGRQVWYLAECTDVAFDGANARCTIEGTAI